MSFRTAPNYGEEYGDEPPEYQAVVSRGRTHRKLTLDALPLAVMKRLLALLPESTVAILTLTNRKLKRTILSITNPLLILRRPRREIERAKYLVTCFDKNYPNHIICYGCGYFHRRQPYSARSKKKPKPYIPAIYNRTASDPAPLKFKSHERSFTWIDIHQAMRGLRHSPRHGIPLLDFVSKITLKTSLHWWYDTATLLVGDRYLLRDRWYRYLKDDHPCGENPRELLCQEANNFCPHSNEAFGWHHLWEHFRTTIETFQGNRRGLTYKRHRCTLCPTEVTIDVEPLSHFSGTFNADKTMRKITRGIVLSYSRYVDFGKCRAPDEPEWVTLTTWIDKPRTANYVIPGWPGYEPPPGLATRPKLDLTHMEPISRRFRLYERAAELLESQVIDIPIAPPPPYQCRQPCGCNVYPTRPYPCVFFKQADNA
jgi:hypothetical protein